MLPHYHRIDIPMYHQQMAFQITGLQFQVRVLITFRIILRAIHITLAIHNLVIAPVNNRPSGHAHLKDLRISQHQVRCHKTAITPAMYPDTVGIHIRQRFQELDTLHLVRHLIDTQITMNHALKSMSTICRAAAIHGKHHITSLCHIEVPTTSPVLPVARNKLYFRASIYIDNRRILLRLIQIRR